MSTLSANLTLEGLDLRRCFLAALSKADFLADCQGGKEWIVMDCGDGKRAKEKKCALRGKIKSVEKIEA